MSNIIGSGFATENVNSTVKSPSIELDKNENNSAMFSFPDIRASETVLNHLCEGTSIKLETVSYDTAFLHPDETKDSPVISEDFALFHELLKENYPLVHASSHVNLRIINDYGLLYHFHGSTVDLEPYCLLAHYDVVPVPQQDIERWSVPPFSGQLKDGYIYGRGTLDMKQVLIALMEVVEHLFSYKWIPQRSFYFAFGHDEETGGLAGAAKIAEHLQQEGVKLSFILDEGLTVLSDLIPGVSVPLALIGVAEKGYLTVKLTTHQVGGHASMPSGESPIGILSKAIMRLEAKPSPIIISSLIDDMIALMMTTQSQLVQIIYKIFHGISSWATNHLIGSVLARKCSTNALVRTTAAATVFKSGHKLNALPSTAMAFVNHRVHPSESIAEVISHDIAVVNDSRVFIEKVGMAFEPIPPSPYGVDVFEYDILVKAINHRFPEALVGPGLLMANTDSRHYLNLTNKIYRFAPSRLCGPSDLARIHGVDERISIKNYEETINFYKDVILMADRSR